MSDLYGIVCAIPDLKKKCINHLLLKSALKRDGKKLYELGRKGKTAEDIKIEPREVNIYRLDPTWQSDDGESAAPHKFQVDVECGGGTYIRSLVRDIGIALDTVATMVSLERTKQGAFLPEHCLDEDDWTIENICKAIELGEKILAECEPSLEESDPTSK